MKQVRRIASELFDTTTNGGSESPGNLPLDLGDQLFRLFIETEPPADTLAVLASIAFIGELSLRCTDASDCWPNSLVYGVRPWAELVEPPVGPSERRSVVAGRIRQIADVDVLQQVDRSELAVPPVVLDAIASAYWIRRSTRSASMALRPKGLPVEK
jgi:hypothetical protein